MMQVYRTHRGRDLSLRVASHVNDQFVNGFEPRTLVRGEVLVGGRATR